MVNEFRVEHNGEIHILDGTSSAMGSVLSPEQEAYYKKEREEEEKERKKDLKQRIDRRFKKAKHEGQLKELMFELAEEIRKENSEW